MHEAYVTKCLLDCVAASLPKWCRPENVVSVNATVGMLDAVNVDSLMFLFDCMKEEYRMEAAQLIIAKEPVSIRCDECGYLQVIYEPEFVCSACGSCQVTIENGQGILLNNIVIMENADENPSH